MTGDETESATENGDESRRVLDAAPFIAALGLQLEAVGDGRCATTLVLERRLLQQDGFVHAGVQATMADHTAGAAAASVVPAGCLVLTTVLTINLLRAARGERLACRARVLRAGRQVTVAEAEVYCIGAGEERLVSKATVTLAVVPKAGRAERP